MKTSTVLSRAAAALACAVTASACGTDPAVADGGTDAPPSLECAKAPDGAAILGMALIRLQSDGAKDSFCIDKYEVSRASYRASLAAMGKTAPAAYCSTRTTHEPLADCVARLPTCTGAECDSLPQTCITYCDAEAYCSARGATLCGRADGTDLGARPGADRWENVWLRTCHNLTTRDGDPTKYGFGDTYAAATCNDGLRPGTGCGASPTTCRSVPSGTLGDCKGIGPYAEVFDIQGNASEFVRATTTEGARTLGLTAGSSYPKGSGSDAPECGVESFVDVAGTTYPWLGFRCCAAAVPSTAK
jgi:formylglycine-generating enzyme